MFQIHRRLQNVIEKEMKCFLMTFHVSYSDFGYSVFSRSNIQSYSDFSGTFVLSSFHIYLFHLSNK